MKELFVAVAGALAAALVGSIVIAIRRAGWKRLGPVLVASWSEADDGGVWRLATTRRITDADLPTKDMWLRDVRDWLRSDFDAVVLGERRFDLTLQSRLDVEVIVTGIDAIVESRRTPTFRSSVTSPPAGAEYRTFVGFDLREGARPQALTVDMQGDARWTDVPFFRDHVVTLQSDGSHSFGVLSRCGKEVVKWRMRVHYQVNGVTRTLVVPPKSKPPLITADAAEAGEFWWAGVAGLPGPPYLRRATPDELAPTTERTHGR